MVIFGLVQVGVTLARWAHPGVRAYGGRDCLGEMDGRVQDCRGGGGGVQVQVGGRRRGPRGGSDRVEYNGRRADKHFVVLVDKRHFRFRRKLLLILLIVV